jgi:hypothetical protein
MYLHLRLVQIADRLFPADLTREAKRALRAIATILIKRLIRPVRVLPSEPVLVEVIKDSRVGHQIAADSNARCRGPRREPRATNVSRDNAIGPSEERVPERVVHSAAGAQSNSGTQWK